MQEKLKRLFIVVPVLFILASGWFAFLKLVTKPPIEATPVLIMIWLSVFILLATLFPDILNRIKKLKFKEFEIELQDTVSKAHIENYITLFDFNEHTFSQKGDFCNLMEIIRQSVVYPDKPILLVVNLKDGNAISIPMLFIYLFFLEAISKSVIVLFISAKNNPSDINDIRKDCIAGAISGRIAIQELVNQYPKLLRIFESTSGYSYVLEHILQNQFSEEKREMIFGSAYSDLREYFNAENEFLTLKSVKSLFKSVLSNHMVDFRIRVESFDEIKKALGKGNEYVLLLENKALKSVVPVSNITKALSLKAINISKSS